MPPSSSAEAGLRLVVQNTFLEAKEEMQPLRRTCSDSWSSSGSGALLEDGDDD